MTIPTSKATEKADISNNSKWGKARKIKEDHEKKTQAVKAHLICLVTRKRNKKREIENPFISVTK